MILTREQAEIVLDVVQELISGVNWPSFTSRYKKDGSYAPDEIEKTFQAISDEARIDNPMMAEDWD